MRSYKVRNDAGDTFDVDEDKVSDAERDGFLPVVSNGKEEHRVAFGDLSRAVKDGYKPMSVSDVGYTESGLRGLAQGVSFGFADELTGGAEALWEAANGDPRTFGELYKAARDESRANYKTAEEANPKTYMAGQVGGAVGTALVPGLGGAGIAKLAAQGAAQGLGSSEADLLEGDLAGAARDTAIGGGIGAATGAIGKGISNALAPSAERAAGSIINVAEDISNPLSTLPRRGYQSVPGKVLGASEGLAGRLENIGNINENVGAAARKTYNAVTDGDLIGSLKGAGQIGASKLDVLKAGLEGARPKTSEQVTKGFVDKVSDMGLGAGILSSTGIGSKVAMGSAAAKPLGAALKYTNAVAKNAANSLSLETVESLAPKLGKYGNALLNAAQRGEQSLAATHFVLSQTDPEYKMMYDDAQGENVDEPPQD